MYITSLIVAPILHHLQVEALSVSNSSLSTRLAALQTQVNTVNATASATPAITEKLAALAQQVGMQGQGLMRDVRVCWTVSMLLVLKVYASFLKLWAPFFCMQVQTSSASVSAEVGGGQGINLCVMHGVHAALPKYIFSSNNALHVCTPAYRPCLQLAKLKAGLDAGNKTVEAAVSALKLEVRVAGLEDGLGVGACLAWSTRAFIVSLPCTC